MIEERKNRSFEAEGSEEGQGGVCGQGSSRARVLKFTVAGESSSNSDSSRRSSCD